MMATYNIITFSRASRGRAKCRAVYFHFTLSPWKNLLPERLQGEGQGGRRGRWLCNKHGMCRGAAVGGKQREHPGHHPWISSWAWSSSWKWRRSWKWISSWAWITSLISSWKARQGLLSTKWARTALPSFIPIPCIHYKTPSRPRFPSTIPPFPHAVPTLPCLSAGSPSPPPRLPWLSSKLIAEPAVSGGAARIDRGLLKC